MDIVCDHENKHYFDQDTYSACSDKDDENDHYLQKYKLGTDPSLAPIVDGVSLSDFPKVHYRSEVVFLVPLELNCSSLGIKLNEFIIDMWGVNIHHDDNKLIFFIRKKFYNIVNDHLLRLFSSVMNGDCVLTSGKVISNCDWYFFCDELLPVAIESLEPILERQDKELYEVFSKARVVDSNKNGGFYNVIRAITDDEKNIVMERAKEFICRIILNSIKLSWERVAKIPQSIDNKSIYKYLDRGYIEGEFGVRLRCSDYIAIFSYKRKLLFKIKPIIRNKFYEIMKNEYKFDGINIVNNFSCFSDNKKLLTIAKDEVKYFLNDGSEKIKIILSRSRVVINYISDRVITNKEKSIVLKNIDKIVNMELNNLFSNVWDDLVEFFRDKSEGVEDVLSNAIYNIISVRCAGSDGSLEIKLKDESISYCNDCYVNDIERSILFDLNKCIRAKFVEILSDKDKFDCFNLVDKSPWGKVSKKILPVVKEEIKPIIERGRAEVNEVLLKSEAVFYKYNGSSITRNFKYEEVCLVLKIVMKCIYKKINFGKLWARSIKSPKYFEEDVSESINLWGVNLHPDDSRLILFIRKKFSVNIRSHLRKLFSNMIKDGSIFATAKPQGDYSWALFSNELIPIAKKSVGKIMEEQYKELDEILSKSYVLDTNKGDVNFCVSGRRITDDEKNNIMVRAKAFICRRLYNSIRVSWISVTNSSVLCNHKEKDIVPKVKIRYEDSVAILNTRREFSRKIKSTIYCKFTEMINNKCKFVDGTVIGIFSWPRVSKDVLPIAKGEVKHFLKDERAELRSILSKARVALGPMVERKLTNKEKSIALANIEKLIDRELKQLFRKVWYDVLEFVRYNYVDIGNFVDTVSFEEGTYECDKVDDSAFKLYHEDDRVIYRVRRKFAAKMNERISSKFCEMINLRYEFDDGTVIGIQPWGDISKNIFPIVKEEVKPIVEMEKIEINKILTRSRAVFPKPDGTSIIRKITSKERSIMLRAIMRCVCKLHNLSRLWRRVTKSLSKKSSVGEFPGGHGKCIPCSTTVYEISKYNDDGKSLASVKSIELKDVYKEELTNIRIEFIGNLGPIIDEVFYSLTNIDTLSSGLDDAILSVSERSYNLFKEGGFLYRVESLLLSAKVVNTFGDDRFITDDESKNIFKSFMDSIDNDRDHLVKKRYQEFIRLLSSPNIVDGFAVVECDGKSEI